MTEPGENGLDALRSGEPGYDPAATEQHEGRYASYFESCRKGLVLLGIYLDDGRFSRQLLRHGSHRRCE
jgi:hypothetical protein